MYNSASYQLLSQPVGRFSNTGLSNIRETTTYPLYQKQEEMGGKRRKKKAKQPTTNNVEGVIKKPTTDEIVKKYMADVLEKKKLALQYPTLYKNPLKKIEDETIGTLKSGFGKRGRPKKIKADAPILDIVNLYEKDIGKIDDKPNKPNASHKKQMKKLASDMLKHHQKFSKIMDKYKPTLEGSGFWQDALGWLETTGADLVSNLPVVGAPIAGLWRHANDIAEALSPSYHRAGTPSNTPVVPWAVIPERKTGEDAKIIAPTVPISGSVLGQKGSGGRLRKRTY